MVQERIEPLNYKALREFASTLRKTVSAEHVLLFGSRAKGTWDGESDYDFIIVSPRFEGQSRRERPVELYRHWYEAGGDAPIDLFCVTPEEFEEARNRITLIAAVLPEAIDLLAPEQPAA
jgi:uncharacterized protein